METLFLLSLVALAWYWSSGAKAHEQAVLAARRACERHSQQLLDETVMLERVRPQRGGDGRLRLRRDYSFEFSGEGASRSPGSLSLFGGHIVGLQLKMPDGTLFDTH